jgi:hypothetical protein
VVQITQSHSWGIASLDPARNLLREKQEQQGLQDLNIKK